MRTFRKKIRLWLLVMVILVGAFVVPAVAATDSYVADNIGILSEYQMDFIKKDLNGLSDIRVVISISDAGNKATDTYAYQVAKSLYEEVFGDRASSGIVIVYCNSLEGFKVGVYSGGEDGLEEKKLKSMIENSYSLYKTDSFWVEGSIVSCIGYLKDLEASKTEETARPQAASTEVPDKNEIPKNWISRTLEWIGAYHVVGSIVGLIFLAGIVVGVVCLWKYFQKRETIIRNLIHWLQERLRRK
ncbi:MAG: hypothetical protein IJ867_07730 [Clostridia bacterium]|nr:hypothetical protein [Clostridia bacterium]